MSSLRLDRAFAADAAAVTEVVVALESSLYGHSTFAQGDLEGEWSGLDLAQFVASRLSLRQIQNVCAEGRRRPSRPRVCISLPSGRPSLAVSSRRDREERGAHDMQRR